jgi:hypothetical protein
VRVVGLAVIALSLAGCSSIEGLLRDVNPPIVRFEVWNRTLDDVTLTDANGTRLHVAACGHGEAAAFRVDGVRVHTKVGYVFGFGSGGLQPPGHQFLVLVEADGESFPTAVEPTAIPPCAGHPHAQPGVFLDP